MPPTAHTYHCPYTQLQTAFSAGTSPVSFLMQKGNEHTLMHTFPLCCSCKTVCKGPHTVHFMSLYLDLASGFKSLCPAVSVRASFLRDHQLGAYLQRSHPHLMPAGNTDVCAVAVNLRANCAIFRVVVEPAAIASNTRIFPALPTLAAHVPGMSRCASSSN